MRSLLLKLLLSSLVVILLPMGLAILWTSKTFSTLLERRFVEKSKVQAERVKLLLNEKQEIATGVANLIAEMPGIQKTLEERDRSGMFQLLLPIVGSIEMDFIEILDREGRIFLRVHDPSNYGDRPTPAEDVRGLLRGMRDLPNYGVEERDGKLYLRAVESIDANGVLGIVGAGYSLSRDLIRKLEQVADGKVVIAAGNRQYSAEGSAPTVTEASSAAEAKIIPAPETEWHREGDSPSLEIRLPLETDRGQEGTISLFFPSQEMTAAIGTLQKTLFSVALVGIVLAFFASWVLSRRLTRPLRELVQRSDKVAAGDYAGAVNVKSRDEIGMLACSFNRMLKELRKSRSEVDSYRQELERKFAETGEELVETEKKRAAMAHMIAHDLKNPLLGIKKTLERLEQTSGLNGPQTRKILEDLLSAGDLVIGMVNEMLDLYRSDFGDLPLAFTPFPMEEPIQASLRILGPELEEKKIQVVHRSDPLEIPVVADKKRLTRLLINLLSNAIKFSPEQGRIYVSFSVLEGDGKSGPQVLIRVEDEGMGIPENDLSKIFDRFYSRDQGRLETGTGLGLPYCKLVAEAHRGKIWAESRSGGGFAVSVILPTNAAGRREAYGT